MRADSGDAITTTRSAGRIFTSPRGKTRRPWRISAATLIRVSSACRSNERPTIASPEARGNVELDDLHPALGEDVRLAGRRQPDDARDGVGGLELRRDHAVDIDLALARQASRSSVLVVRVDCLGLGEPLGQDRANQVGLLARAAGNEQICLLDARLADDRAGRPVALHVLMS